MPNGTIDLEGAKQRLFKRYHDDSRNLDQRIRDFPKRFIENPDTYLFKTRRKYSKMDFLKQEIPEKLTLEWFKKHAQIKLVGEGLRWFLISWRNIIFIQISNNWKPDEMDVYVDRLSGLPAMLSNKWDKIFLVFDLSRMRFKKEDAFRYMRSNWLRFLDREDMKVCIVEENKMRRILLRSVYMIVGKLHKIKIFSDCNEAFGWVREAIVSYETIDRR